MRQIRWFNSEDTFDRTCVVILELSNPLGKRGTLLEAERLSPNDSWPAPTKIGRGYSIASAESYARLHGCRVRVDDRDDGAGETPAEELGRLRRELSELDPEWPEHRITLDRIAVLTREAAEQRRRGVTA